MARSTKAFMRKDHIESRIGSMQNFMTLKEKTGAQHGQHRKRRGEAEALASGATDMENTGGTHKRSKAS